MPPDQENRELVPPPVVRTLPDILSAPAGPPEAVREHAPCANCGYDLRGLPLGGRCPECAAPLELALRQDSLDGVDPGWLRTIARGARLAGLGLLIVVAGCLLFDVAHWLGLARIVGWVGEIAIGAIVATGGILLFCAGVWMFVTPSPHDLRKGWRSLPWALRAGCATTGGAILVSLLLTQARAGAHWQWVLHLVFGPLGLAGIATMTAFACYTAELARRAGQQHVARRNRKLGWWYLGGWLAWFLGALSLAAGIPIGSLLLIPGVPTMSITGALLLFTTPGMLVGALDRQARRARANWGSALRDNGA